MSAELMSYMKFENIAVWVYHFWSNKFAFHLLSDLMTFDTILIIHTAIHLALNCKTENHKMEIIF